MLAWETGMRDGEIRSLRWADVNLAEHKVRLSRTKNGDMRTVPLSEEAERALSPPLWWNRGSSFVFPAETASGYVGEMAPAFRRLATAAGVPGVRFHDFRHTFCTRMVERGVDVITLKEITGHRTLAMLQRYSHPSDARKLEIVRGASYHRQSSDSASATTDGNR
jgi:integrase